MTTHRAPWARLAASASLALCACGGVGYRAEQSGGQLPERCADSEPLSACEQRLDGYAARLDRLLEAPVRPDGESLSSPAEGELVPSEPGPTEPSPQAALSAPDCGQARDLRDRICELADAICELAGRPGAGPQTKATCDAAHQSCERARRRVAAACPN